MFQPKELREPCLGREREGSSGRGERPDLKLQGFPTWVSFFQRVKGAGGPSQRSRGCGLPEPTPSCGAAVWP